MTTTTSARISTRSSRPGWAPRIGAPKTPPRQASTAPAANTAPPAGGCRCPAPGPSASATVARTSAPAGSARQQVDDAGPGRTRRRSPPAGSWGTRGRRADAGQEPGRRDRWTSSPNRAESRSATTSATPRVSSACRGGPGRPAGGSAGPAGPGARPPPTAGPGEPERADGGMDVPASDGRVGAGQKQRPVGEVQYVHDAEHERQPDRYSEQQHPEGETVDDRDEVVAGSQAGTGQGPVSGCTMVLTIRPSRFSVTRR